jgi:3-deoxy-D-manno-octulosonic-acid transferase
MYFLYNIALYAGFLILSPRFAYDAITKGKYAAGFKQRLGHVPTFESSGRQVVLLHCVSVGEANAALPLARKLSERFPDIAFVISTTTKTGQQVARDAYAGLADLVVYFPFDFNWAVKRFLTNIKPDLVLLTETEIWFNFIRRASEEKIRLAIVNGRLSERSFRRYSRAKTLMKRVLGYLDLALMQGDADAHRLLALGASEDEVKVTGNIKFDTDVESETDLTVELRKRFGFGGDVALILAASTHSPEEQALLDAVGEIDAVARPRLMLVPRHPERFNEVASVVSRSGRSLARRSEPPSPKDATAEVILLDSIGELRSAYPLADVVFVGGSLIPHGGQSIFEPAAAGKAIVTGPYTANFDAGVKEFLSRDALIQLPDATTASLAAALSELLADPEQRNSLGENALAVMSANRGAVDRTIDELTPLLTSRR